MNQEAKIQELKEEELKKIQESKAEFDAYVQKEKEELLKQ